MTNHRGRKKSLVGWIGSDWDLKWRSEDQTGWGECSLVARSKYDIFKGRLGEKEGIKKVRITIEEI